MEHSIDWGEYEILRETDFIIPLKRVGLITRTVLEAVQLFYRPRRIVVVTPRSEAALLRLLSPFWSVGPALHIIAEEDYFKPNFGLSIGDLMAEYGAPSEDERRREPGWWLQQLIKLGAGTQVPNISPVYVVWDGDLIPVRRWKLCERVRAENCTAPQLTSLSSFSGSSSPTDSQASADEDRDSSIRYYIAILQAESRSAFNTAQYAECMRALCGFGPREPEGGGTFVAHHMVFHRALVGKMLDHMVRHTGSNLPWPRLIMSYSRRYFRFSEYKTYASFVLQRMQDLRIGGDFRVNSMPSDESLPYSIGVEGGDTEDDYSPNDEDKANSASLPHGLTTASLTFSSSSLTSSSGDTNPLPPRPACDEAAFRYHLLGSFGSGGIRIRGGSDIVAELISFCGVRDGGIPYNRVREFVRLKWKAMVTEAAASKRVRGDAAAAAADRRCSEDGTYDAKTHFGSTMCEVQLNANIFPPAADPVPTPETSMGGVPSAADTMITDPVVPAYLQIDHIYGLGDVDLNLTQPALSLPDRTRKRVDSSQSSRFTLDLVMSGMMEQHSIE